MYFFGVLVDVSKNFEKMGIFWSFWDISTKTTTKITFDCISIYKFPKNFENRAQKFFEAPSAPRKNPLFQFFCLFLLEGWPPKNNTGKKELIWQDNNYGEITTKCFKRNFARAVKDISIVGKFHIRVLSHQHRPQFSYRLSTVANSNHVYEIIFVFSANYWITYC